MLKDKLKQQEEERKAIISYLRTKTDSEDWHAVADAAMDLREIEARIMVIDIALEELEEEEEHYCPECKEEMEKEEKEDD